MSLVFFILSLIFLLFHKTNVHVQLKEQTTNQDVSFYCRNRTDGSLYQVWPVDWNLRKKIDRSQETVFLIHGWQTNLWFEWIQLMLRGLLIVTFTFAFTLFIYF